jgi:rRNA maturation endonuclease Nob1
LVPIKEETVEFTAGLIGGVAGLLVGGPVVGAIGAAAANYVSKMEGEVTDIVQAVSKSSIQVYNYLTTLDSKYEILKKAQDSLQNSLDKLKAQEVVDPNTVNKVEQALSNTRAKIAEINDEYDLVGGGFTALGVIGDLVEKAIKKAGEINAEYKISDRAWESLQNAINKAKESASSSTTTKTY